MKTAQTKKVPKSQKKTQNSAPKRGPKATSSSPRVKVIGSGEAFDSGLGNTAYLFQAPKTPSILFDCGYQIPERLWAKGLHAQIDAICFTHLHADHSFGIVPMLVRYWEEGRTDTLTILGPRGTENYILKLLNMGYPGIQKRFQYSIQFITLSPKKSIEWNDFRFSVAGTVHSVLNYTIRVDLPGASKKSFSISGDGQITEATKKLVSNVNLHFQEVYSLKPEIPVHADFETVIDWGSKTSIQTLVLSHFSRGMKAELQKKTFNAQNKLKTRIKAALPDQVYDV